jgi:hypothetical protein
MEPDTYRQFLDQMAFGWKYLRVRKEFSQMHTPHPIDPWIAIILHLFGS